jgi:elongation factor 2
MGELHLEVAVKHLQDMLSGMGLQVSPPRVVYREKTTKKGVVATALSPNQQNKFTVQTEPLTEEPRSTDQATQKPDGAVAVDENGNVLVDCTGKTDQFREVLDFIISGFTFACKAGPLCGEPMRGVQVNLMDVQLTGNAEQFGPVEVMRGVGKAVFGSFLTAEPVLLEPVYRTVISAPTEVAGACSKIISGRRGKISSFEQKGAFTVLTGLVPVAGTLGLTAELRSATSGRAFWQSMFSHWERLPAKLEAKTISEARKRKGLPAEVPKAERFMEFLEENP